MRLVDTPVWHRRNTPRASLMDCREAPTLHALKGLNPHLTLLAP